MAEQISAADATCPGKLEEAEDTAFGAADATCLGKAEEAEDTALWAE